MGLNNTYALGRNVTCVAQNESTFGAGPPVVGSGPGTTWTAGDSIQLLGGVTVEPAEDRKVRSDARLSRSAYELIQGQRSTNVTMRTYILPPTDPGSGSATTGLPDVAALLTSALGVQTINASTVVYSLSAGQTVPPSYTALFANNSIFSQLVRGGLIEEFRVSVPNGDEPTFEFTGPAREHLIAASATASAAITGGATSENVTISPTSDSRKFDVGAYISVGTSTNLRISAINHSTGVLTVQAGTDPGVDNVSAGTGTAIVPYTSYAEGSGASGLEPSTLISSINGSLDLGSDTDIVFQSFELTLKNNWSEVRPALSQYMADANPGFREVTGTVGFWVRDVDIIRAIARPRYVQVSGVNSLALTVTLGGTNTGDGQLVISIPNAHLDFAAAEIPESESGTIQVPFTALATDINDEDELTLTFSVT